MGRPHPRSRGPRPAPQEGPAQPQPCARGHLRGAAAARGAHAHPACHPRGSCRRRTTRGTAGPRALPLPQRRPPAVAGARAESRRARWTRGQAGRQAPGCLPGARREQSRGNSAAPGLWLGGRCPRAACPGRLVCRCCCRRPRAAPGAAPAATAAAPGWAPQRRVAQSPTPRPLRHQSKGQCERAGRARALAGARCGPTSGTSASRCAAAGEKGDLGEVTGGLLHPAPTHSRPRRRSMMTSCRSTRPGAAHGRAAASVATGASASRASALYAPARCSRPW
jgi:hypothetical protein